MLFTTSLTEYDFEILLDLIVDWLQVHWPCLFSPEFNAVVILWFTSLLTACRCTDHEEGVVCCVFRFTGQEGSRGRPYSGSIHQNVAVAGLGRGHVLPAGIGRGTGAGEARIQHRRLRLYDVHRQFRTVARARRRGHREEGPGLLRCPVGQPQLRGPHPSQHASQLLGLPTARRSLRYCW